MKNACCWLFTFIFSSTAYAQEIDSIFFHLYTDSLKKGTYNYINVDGKTKTGKWIPLTSTELLLISSAGTIEGNNLILPADSNWEKVQITVILKKNQGISISIVIPVKKQADPSIIWKKDSIPAPIPPPVKKKKKKQ